MVAFHRTPRPMAREQTTAIRTPSRFCRNRGHGGTVGPGTLPRTVARSGEVLEPARDRGRQRVLEHMRAAERGLRRLEAALDKTGPEALIPILKALGLTSFL